MAEVAGSQTKLAADVEALNSKIAIQYINSADQLGITSDYTVRSAFALITGNVIQLIVHVNNDGNAFPTGRFTLLRFTADINPRISSPFVCGASTGINLYVNRMATGIIASNAIYIDSVSNTDVREIVLSYTYVKQ